MAKCYKLRHINKIMFFEFQKGGRPPKPPPWVRHWAQGKSLTPMQVEIKK